MLDAALRPVKDRLLGPIARVAAPRVHPTAVTVLGFATGLACAGSLYAGAFGAGLALWLLNRALDGLDGLVARTAARQSDLGGYLDIVLDFTVYAAIPIALVHGRPGPDAGAGLALSVMLGAFYVNAASWLYLSALLEKRPAATRAPDLRATSIEMPSGLVEGTETILLYAAFMAAPRLATDVFWLMTVLLVVTIAQRVAWAARGLPARSG